VTLLLHVLIIAQVAQIILAPVACIILGATSSTTPSNRKK